jgi:hypothetical protein
MLLIVRLRIQVRWNPSSHYESFHVTLFQYHLRIEVNKMTIEDEWLEPLMIGPLLTMVVLCLVFFERIESRLNLRSGGATRGKWRIPDNKGGEWYVFMFGALKVVDLA